MSGEGVIGSLREIADRAMRPRFDQRPGDLDPTSGLAPPVACVGHRDGEQWQVLLLSGALRIGLTPAQARDLAVQLVDMAALIDEGWL